ncbi:HAD-IC family P-type ATPase [Leucobacter rhizosphaerae]|uniref:HAD-IC family P-type ATPase n=1 Tax=Leucobacter rhizosphaerae TaxID=2932245 RepID=UPI0032119DE6
MEVSAGDLREEDAERTSEVLDGLLEAEAERRHLAGLGNVLPGGSSRSLWEILVANVFTLFNAIVFAGFGILLALGRWQDALFGLPALMNTVIGVVQEFSAKRTLDRLAVLNAPTARVLREGRIREIALDRVVMGDLLVLRTGDQVTADSRVVQTDATGPGGLEVDESLLTGESDPVRKRVDDEVLSGSSVVAGSGIAEVIRVGADSYAAKLTAEARKFSLVRSELRSSIDRLLKWITWALGPMILIVANGQMQAQGGWAVAIGNGQWREAVVGAVAAVIAMVPLGLVLVTSIAFAVSGVTLASRKVLIQELPAVEGLARVDALCLDKTGTLTTGEMVFDAAHVLHPVAGWERVLGAIGDAPDANGTARCLAEPYGGAESPLPVATAVPFDSVRKWSAFVLAENGAGVDPGTWVLGAPDFVLGPDAGLAEDREGASADPVPLALAGDLAAAGLRTLVLAHSPAALDTDAEHGLALPAELQPVALLTFRERVREDAAQTLGFFADQGVEVRVISGDDPRTVAAVAREIGLDCEAGFDARRLPEDQAALGEVLERERVFGRVTPAQKLAMVHALQARGHVVAMTGDGVNDALAIKEADLGIAMDTAAQATKAVARIVLLDGRFDRMPGVVAEGRRVIANIERVSMLFLTKTTYAFAIAVVFGLLAWSFPFLPRQLSITDGLTIGIPAFFLALMPNADRYRSGFLKRSLAFAIPSGLIVTAALIVLHVVGDGLGDFSVTDMQAASTLTLAGIALWVLAVLARPVSPFRILIVLAMYAGLALVWVIPLTRDFFEVTWLPQPLALLVLGIVATGIVLVELLRAWHLRFTRAPKL